MHGQPMGSAMGHANPSMVIGPGSSLGSGMPPMPTLRNRLEQVYATLVRARQNLNQAEEKIGTPMNSAGGATPDPTDPSIMLLTERLGSIAAELEILSNQINGSL